MVRVFESGMHEAHDKVCRRVGFAASYSGLRVRNFSALQDGDVYQFGVANGGTLEKLLAIFNRTTWGFDSFSGLPSEQAGELSVNDWRPGMKRGGTTNTDQTVRTNLARKLNGTVDVNRLLTLISGMYGESLRPGLARERGMRPAVYVDVDADLYKSSHQALAWMYAEQLVVPGTVIGFDDWWALPCAANDTHAERYGEAKAHAQLAQRYGAYFRCVCGPCANLSPGVAYGGRTYFVLEALRESKARAGSDERAHGSDGGVHDDDSRDVGGSSSGSFDSGFHMALADRVRWMRAARGCAVAKHMKVYTVGS